MDIYNPWGYYSLLSTTVWGTWGCMHIWGRYFMSRLRVKKTLLTFLKGHFKITFLNRPIRYSILIYNFMGLFKRKVKKCRLIYPEGM